MDGLTVVLTVQAQVNPGTVNNIKLAVADVSDSKLDSAVFIQSGSFKAVPPGLSVSDESIAEGNSGTTNLNFDVTIAPPSTKTVTVQYSTSDIKAKAGIDYIPTSGSLTFAPGETLKTVSVPIIGDTIIEGNDTFFVNLTNSTGADITDSKGLGTILNDDGNGISVLSNLNVAINEDIPFAFSTKALDGIFADQNDEVPQSIRIDTVPNNGTLVVGSTNTAVKAGDVVTRAQLASLRFVPASNFFGSATFQFNASDGTAFANNPANVNITVNSVEDLPTITDILPDDTDNDDSMDQRTITVTPAAGQVGVAKITVSVTDEAGGVSSNSFTVNGAPVLAPINVSISQGKTFFSQLQTADPNGDALTYTVTAGSLPSGVSLSAAGLFAGTPTTTGTSNATITVSDGADQVSTPVTFTIVVPKVNNKPVVDNQTLSASVGKPLSIPLSATDADGDTMTFVIASGSTLPPQTTLSPTSVLGGVPTQTGVFPFSVTVTDGNGSATTANFLLIVTSAEDGQGPIITRAQLAALTLSGTVRDVAASGVTPSGVNRMLFQLRRVSDGYAYDGSAFTPNVNIGYIPVTIRPDNGDPAATRTWSHSLSMLPPASVMTPGRYSMSILAQDNAGNYGITVIYITIPASSTSSLSAGGGSGGSS